MYSSGVEEPRETPEERPGALVLTDRPVALAVAPCEDERTPEGMVCLATHLEGRLVARCVVPPEVAAFLAEYALFEDPVPLALAAEEEPPGLQCRLFAIVHLPDLPADDEEAAEPWAASVPSSNFERVVQDDTSGTSGEEGQQAAILLGHVVRFARDRRHPDNLPLEAADVLASIVSGNVSEVVDRVLDDLLP